MNSSNPFGEEAAKSGNKADTRAKASPSAGCSFCGFVTRLYPTLRGMTTMDEAVFREHLKKAHGLKKEISP